MCRSSALLFCVALTGVISSPACADDAVRVVYPCEDRATAAALVKPAGETYAGELRNVLAKIANDAQLRIVIDEQSLEEYAVDLDDVIDYDVQDLDRNWAVIKGLDPQHRVTVGDLLEILFEDRAIGYVIEDGVLKIKAKAEAARKKVVRGYDVSSMTDSSMSIETLATTVSHVASNLEPTETPSTVLAGGSGGGHFIEPHPVQVTPYKKMLVCLGSQSDQERVARAIASLRELDSE